MQITDYMINESVGEILVKNFRVTYLINRIEEIFEVALKTFKFQNS